MKKLSKNNGTASMFVLVVILFFIIFLLSMYGYITKSEITQLDQVSKIKSIYEKDVNNLNETYNELKIRSDMIPICTAEQFLEIGCGKDVEVDGETYKYSSDANYKLVEDIEVDYEDLPIKNTANFTGKLDGKDKTLTVVSKEDVTNENVKLFENDSKSYDHLNMNIEIVCTFGITPTPETANVTISLNGETLATGTGTQTVEVEKGSQISYVVSQEGYVTQSGTETVNDNTEKTIILEEEKTITPEEENIAYDYNITSKPSDSKIVVTTNRRQIASGTGSTIAHVKSGTVVSLAASRNYYQTKHKLEAYM